MINFLQKLNPFRAPTAAEIQARQLDEAKALYLEHAKMAEYHSSIRDMSAKRIDRLKKTDI